MEEQNLKNLFLKFNINGYINIFNNSSKTISYTALGDETSFQNNIEKETKIILIKDGKKLCLKTKDSNYDNLEKLIEANIDFINLTNVDEENLVPEIKENEEFDEKKFDINAINAEFLQKQLNTIKSYSYAKNVNMESMSYSVEDEERVFINSFGSIKKYSKTSCFYYLELFYNSPQTSDTDYEMKSCANLAEISVDFVKNIEKKLLDKTNPQKAEIESQKHTITLKNKVVVSFLEELMGSLFGENIRQKMSFIKKDQIGQKIISDKLSLVSNPQIPNSCYNKRFDGEGFSTEKLDIINNGVLKNIFLDYKNSLKFNLRPTGNPTFSNLEVVGEFDKNYLKKSSFLFTNLMAFHNIDSTTGKFALEGEGFEIKSGKIDKFVKNVSISGNVLDLFQNIECLGDDIYINSNVRTPSITFANQYIVV
ncbi:MAG: TldD/PmbA family protein [Candidatus Gracilibacteria bacterium]|nr:TldD/PmbA family protein [Candidatus Gracilibacteria bacterium]MDD4530795.1 TldD/PmbA family protein [Candidatus Gracilibacteria bacterium]